MQALNNLQLQEMPLRHKSKKQVLGGNLAGLLFFFVTVLEGPGGSHDYGIAVADKQYQLRVICSWMNNHKIITLHSSHKYMSRKEPDNKDEHLSQNEQEDRSGAFGKVHLASLCSHQIWSLLCPSSRGFNSCMTLADQYSWERLSKGKQGSLSCKSHTHTQTPRRWIKSSEVSKGADRRLRLTVESHEAVLQH
jgi:hypothetical protein